MNFSTRQNTQDQYIACTECGHAFWKFGSRIKARKSLSIAFLNGLLVSRTWRNRFDREGLGRFWSAVSRKEGSNIELATLQGVRYFTTCVWNRSKSKEISLSEKARMMVEVGQHLHHWFHDTRQRNSGSVVHAKAMQAHHKFSMQIKAVRCTERGSSIAKTLLSHLDHTFRNQHEIHPFVHSSLAARDECVGYKCVHRRVMQCWARFEIDDNVVAMANL